MDKNWKNMKKTFLFDLGNTIMRDFPDEKGKMKAWNKIEAMPNAEMMLEKLYQQHDCFIATNAKDSLKEDIIEALHRVNLDKYIKDIFCFNDIGSSKPTKAYLDKIIIVINVYKD